jgi:hypothetical protein
MIRLAIMVERRRRRTVALSRIARARALEAQVERGRAVSALRGQLTSRESLILAFVGGITVGALSPRATGRHKEPPHAGIEGASSNGALNIALRLARTYAVKRLLNVALDASSQALSNAGPVPHETVNQGSPAPDMS